MKNRDGLINSNHWATPKALYDQLNKEFNFDFDPCPLHSKFDGLQISWGSRNYVNPPYDKINKPKFINKAYEEYKKGKLVVMLLPVATSTKQFHEIIAPNCEIRFIKKRVKFCGVNTKGQYTETSAGKHDSMIIIFNPSNDNKKNVSTY